MSEKNIYQRMSIITKEAKSIPKNGYNAFNKYKYVQAVDVINSMQNLLTAHGVALTISETELEKWTEQTAKGGLNHFSQIKCEATFINIDKPSEKITVNYYTVGADTLDKDIYKAKTGGLKYLLTQQFLIVTDNLIDPEEQKKPDNPSIKPNTRQKDKQNGNLSDPQIKRMFAIGYNNKWTGDQIKEVMYDLYRLESTSDLRKTEYDKICKILETSVYTDVVWRENSDSFDPGKDLGE